MNLGVLKRAVRGVRSRLRLITPAKSVSGKEPGQEQPPGWYDAVYSTSQGYSNPYTRSCYYYIWSVIADRLVRGGAKRILEIGCGTGQFAALLYDEGVRDYVGLDFSPTAAKLASQQVPSYRFLVDDARTSDIYRTFEYDAIVCTEVLEHIEDDLYVISRFGSGKRCLCTVPNFPYESHVRHFRDAADVAGRYGRFFKEYDVITRKSPNSEEHKLFLLDGIRNEATV